MDDPLAKEKRRAAKQRCPRCGAAAAIPIIFGLPDADLFHAAEAGEARLGGCLIDGGEPNWACRECGEEW